MRWRRDYSRSAIPCQRIRRTRISRQSARGGGPGIGRPPVPVPDTLSQLIENEWKKASNWQY